MRGQETGSGITGYSDPAPVALAAWFQVLVLHETCTHLSTRRL